MKEYEKWFKKAEQDLFVIKNIINISDAPYEICCFHAQQAAEKYLKAYLTAPRYPDEMHDLTLLDAQQAYQNSLTIKEFVITHFFD